MQVDFYHLSSSPIERILPRVAEKVVGEGGRLLVVAGDSTLIAALDAALWSYDPASFLPHGRAGGEGEADQPILLSLVVAPANGARNIALADGIWRDEALAFDRAFHFFDDATIAAARAAWKGLADREGVERNFWKQGEGGKWEKAA